MVPSLPSVGEYVDYVIRNGKIEPEVLVLTISLIEKFILRLPEGAPIHFLKLIAITIFIAQKYLHESSSWSIPEFGRLVGLSSDSLRELEIEYLIIIDFSIYLTRKQFKIYTEELL